MKTIGIEALLVWAFTRELCKGGADSGGSGGARWAQVWGHMREMAELGIVIDRSPNAFGVIPDIGDEGGPHPDALLVGEAVRALAARAFTVPDMPLFNEFPDPHGLIAMEVDGVRRELRQRGNAANARHVMTIVIGAAVLGRGPDGACEPPRYRMVEKYGKPAWFVARRMRGISGEVHAYEDEGFDAAKGRPKRGAYRKWQLCEPLRGPAMARIDLLWWREALGRIGADLDGRLSAHRLVIGAGAEIECFAHELE